MIGVWVDGEGEGGQEKGGAGGDGGRKGEGVGGVPGMDGGRVGALVGLVTSTYANVRAHTHTHTQVHTHTQTCAHTQNCAYASANAHEEKYEFFIFRDWNNGQLRNLILSLFFV